MQETLTPIAKCPKCGTTMEIMLDNKLPSGAATFYLQVGDLQITHTAKLASDGDYLRYRNEGTAARLATERWFQEDANHISSSKDWADLSYLDEVAPAPFTEQALPYLALVAVILGFFALGSSEPITFSVILLNPVLVSLYLHTRSQRRQKAQGLLDSTKMRRTSLRHTVRAELEEEWHGVSA